MKKQLHGGSAGAAEIHSSGAQIFYTIAKVQQGDGSVFVGKHIVVLSVIEEKKAGQPIHGLVELRAAQLLVVDYCTKVVRRKQHNVLFVLFSQTMWRT